MPMGMLNASASAQMLSDIAFHALLNKCAVVYIDDLFTYSPDQSQYVHDLAKVFACIRKAGLILNPKKCKFNASFIEFLGFVINKKGIHTEPTKIKKVKGFPLPQHTRGLHSFIGLTNYYKRFVHSYAKISQPIYDMLKGNPKKITWTPEAINAFETLKPAMFLEQKEDDGRNAVILYDSRALSPYKKNYGISKLECLAVVWAIKKLPPYLLSKPFTIITDHSSLRGLLNSPRPEGILARWITILSEYSFEIKYRPGKENTNADFLSRLGY
ncbi:hypothetical protein INT45_009323 [Circinella minor]|uniref:Reverse transcriptase domain-containing protein n=1 Tax=Circinella minor TaxID=1195481 RepID=A0A8H7RND1_9FUNG|nr:hypothetical protein INT45_009323 [Circinella minor]